MELYWLRVDAVLQHPALVVVCGKTQLALLVRVHDPLVHPETPVGGHVPVALQSSLVPFPTQLILLLVNALGRHLGLPAGLVLYEVALAAKGDGAGALLLELEQAGCPIAPLVPRQPLSLLLLKLLQALRLDGLLQLVVRQGEVHAVRVHLYELEVPPVKKVVQEVVVELQHAGLCHLIHYYSRLERAVNFDLWLAALDFVDVPDYVQVFEPSRAELLVNLGFVLGVYRARLALHFFDELAIGAVSQELEHFCEQRLLLVRVTRPPVVGDLIHKPVENLLGPVVNRTVKSKGG